MQQPNLNLKGHGWVKGEILWSHEHLFKITFLKGFFKKRVTEVFHFREILNFNEIYINKNNEVKYL